MSDSSDTARVLSAEVRQDGPATGEGRVRTHSLLIDRPVAKGGADRGPMGGELLLLALGGCFLSNLLAAIRTREARAEAIQVVVEAQLDGAPERFTRFTLRVRGTYDDRAQMEKLVTIAERGCIVANTLLACTPVEVVLEDMPLG